MCPEETQILRYTSASVEEISEVEAWGKSGESGLQCGNGFPDTTQQFNDHSFVALCEGRKVG